MNVLICHVNNSVFRLVFSAALLYYISVFCSYGGVLFGHIVVSVLKLNFSVVILSFLLFIGFSVLLCWCCLFISWSSLLYVCALSYVDDSIISYLGNRYIFLLGLFLSIVKIMFSDVIILFLLLRKCSFWRLY